MAIKIYISNYNSGRAEVFEKQFKLEVKKLTGLKHNNIATLYSAYPMDGLYIAVMEYVDGVTLKDWLKKNRNFSYIERINFLRSLFEVVIYYQEHDIFHGDLHMNNFLIDKQGEFRIIDFGTSLFSGKQNTHKRENKLNYQFVKDILGDEIDDKWFSFIGFINKHPLLISKTLKAYLYTMECMKAASLPQPTYLDIRDMFLCLSKSIYID